MKNNYIRISGIVASSLLFIVSFQNCSKKAFSGVDPSAKLAVLDEHGGLENIGKENHSQPKNPVVETPIVSPVVDGKTRELTVVRWCRGADSGNVLEEATSLTIDVYPEGGITLVGGNIKEGVAETVVVNKICSFGGPEYVAQALSGKIKFPASCDLSKIKKDAVIIVKDQNGNDFFEGTNKQQGRDAEMYRSALGPVTEIGKGGLIDGATPDAEMKIVGYGLHLLRARGATKTGAPYCDRYNSSPLVVDMRDFKELSKDFTLTAPMDGVRFDILGLRSNPQAHAKKLISRIKDPRVMPIVLYSKGAKFGIDQMFGDNTEGPDKQNPFAADGFAALAKYDGLKLDVYGQALRDAQGKLIVEDADGVITKDDDVFSHLRLFYDKNTNGKLDSGELITFDKAEIELIDLKYDKKHYSQDQYGNEIKYKSVVKMKAKHNAKKQVLRPVFDVWYMVDEMIQ